MYKQYILLLVAVYLTSFAAYAQDCMPMQIGMCKGGIVSPCKSNQCSVCANAVFVAGGDGQQCCQETGCAPAR